MREILFIGKRLDNGELAIGDLRQDKDCGTCFIEGYDYYTSETGLEREPFGYEVDPSTVGQYTGLTDKNGTKIFEGDILEDALGWVYEVKWDNENGRFLGHHSKPRGDTYICYVNREPKATVIGNIHDKEVAQ